MVTVRLPFSALRPRPTAAGSWRLLWLGVLLLGLLYTHGLSGESAAGHMTTGSAATATHSAHPAVPAGDAVSAHPDGQHQPGPTHHDGEGGHPAQNCLSGDPQQSVDLPLLCLAPLGGVATPGHLTRTVPLAAEAILTPPPSRHSPVLLI